MIDWSRVATLRDEIGADDFDEVVELFISEVEETIDRLKTAPEVARLEEDLHFLKGSALNLGFDDFSGLCEKGEKMSADGNADAVDLSLVLTCYETSKQSFLKDLPNAFG